MREEEAKEKAVKPQALPAPQNAAQAEIVPADSAPVISQELAVVDNLSPLTNLEAYLSALQRIELLSPEEEARLMHAYRYDDDVEAARRLILANLRFVAHVSRGYSGYGLPRADIIQEGNIGLMRALKHYNPEVGVRFISFAVHWIRSEIHEYVLKNWKIVKLSTTKAQRKLFFKLRSKKEKLGALNPEEASKIAEDLGVRTSDVLEMDKRLSGGIQVPYDSLGESGDSDEGNKSAGEFYLEDHSYRPDRLVSDENWEAFQNSQLRQGLAELDDRSRDIIVRRWMSEKRSTLEELADAYSISAERVRQIEQAGMKKLRKGLEQA